jgi:hypothetical protein
MEGERDWKNIMTDEKGRWRSEAYTKMQGYYVKVVPL